MNDRQYYVDSYTKRFKSSIVERLSHGAQPAVVLESTYFYPTSGGQPHDIGKINGARVVDVVVRSGDEAILHVLDGAVESDQVMAEIDWSRRFDHMQQHSGQHVLSQSFLRELKSSTVSFHMGAKSSTLDLDGGQLDEVAALEVELLANQIVWENRPIVARQVPREEATALPLRKQPPGQSDRLRLVEIQDFDVSACGGTHVAHTGEIGIIKIVKWERSRGLNRVEFLCGSRAVSDYGAKSRIISNLSTLFTTGYWELEDSVKRQIEEATSNRRQLRKYQKSLIKYQVGEILRDAGKVGDCTVVEQVFLDRTLNEIKMMANQISSYPNSIALLGAVEEKTYLVFAKNKDASGDMGRLIKDAFALLGSGSGGGSPTYAQGSAPDADAEQITKVLSYISRKLE